MPVLSTVSISSTEWKSDLWTVESVGFSNLRHSYSSVLVTDGTTALPDVEQGTGVASHIHVLSGHLGGRPCRRPQLFLRFRRRNPVRCTTRHPYSYQSARARDGRIERNHQYSSHPKRGEVLSGEAGRLVVRSGFTGSKLRACLTIHTKVLLIHAFSSHAICSYACSHIHQKRVCRAS